MFDKIVLVTRKTRLEELIERFNTRAQAKFYIQHAGGDFSTYVAEHDAYQRSLESVRRSVEVGLKIQVMDRALVPTYLFSKTDLIVTLGQDGLVANTAKYVGGQPILAVNPDPERFDGVLLPFQPAGLRAHLDLTLAARARMKAVTLAEAKLKDGQRLLAFNDLFIGAASHVSARYRIRHGEKRETQSSSGIIVSTGAGSTGWLSSIFNETSGILAFLGGAPVTPLRIEWEEHRLLFVVREPFVSRHSQASRRGGNRSPWRAAGTRIADALRRRDLFRWRGSRSPGFQFRSDGDDWNCAGNSQPRRAITVEMTKLLVTVDVVLLTIRDRRLHLLLIRRLAKPFEHRYALPGRVRSGRRIARLRSGPRTPGGDRRRKGLPRTAVYVRRSEARPARPRRSPSPTTRWCRTPSSCEPGPMPSDAAWFPVTELPALAFDHRKIVEYAHQRIRNKLNYTNVGFELLPEKFTLTELQLVHEAILGEPLDKRNFRRKIVLKGIVKPIKEWQQTGRKPAQLFRFSQ